MKVSVKHYVVLFSASIGSLFAGSQFMHAILKPDLTIPDLLTDEDKKLLNQFKKPGSSKE